MSKTLAEMIIETLRDNPQRRFNAKEQGLYCLRIDGKTSRNSYGSSGNQWLHPDIVAMEALNKGLDTVVHDSVCQGNDSVIRLYSFEVKKQPTQGKVGRVSSRQSPTHLGPVWVIW